MFPARGRDQSQATQSGATDARYFGLGALPSDLNPRITREPSLIATPLYDVIHISTANANMRRHRASTNTGGIPPI